jgi:hypothetical protein
LLTRAYLHASNTETQLQQKRIIASRAGAFSSLLPARLFFILP